MINRAKKGDIIELPDSNIRVQNLFINKAVTLIGKPGSILEVYGGSIIVDFKD